MTNQRGLAAGQFRKDQNHELRMRAYHLRLAGLSYVQIGEELNRSGETVRRWVRGLIDGAEVEMQPEILRLEMDRLDKLQVAAERPLMSENLELRLKAIDRVLKIQESRRKLLGLDAADKVNVEVTEKTQAEIDLEKLIAKANKQFGAQEQEMKQGATQESEGDQGDSTVE
jgi:hypothetical protein